MHNVTFCYLFLAQEIAHKLTLEEEHLKQHGYKPKTLVSTHDRSFTEKQKLEMIQKHGIFHFVITVLAVCSIH